MRKPGLVLLFLLCSLNTGFAFDSLKDMQDRADRLLHGGKAEVPDPPKLLTTNDIDDDRVIVRGTTNLSVITADSSDAGYIQLNCISCDSSRPMLSRHQYGWIINKKRDN